MLRTFVTRTRNRSLKRRGTRPTPPRWHEITILEKAVNDTPKRRGNFSRGRASKQNKAVWILDPVPETTKTTFVKILDEMDNEAKKKLLNFRDNNNGALLFQLCEKAITLCKTYGLYNDNGDWKAMAQAQHRAMYGECKNSEPINTRECAKSYVRRSSASEFISASAPKRLHIHSQ